MNHYQTSGGDYCQISAWCPVENDQKLSTTAPVLSNTDKFTVYIKNSIAFPYFGAQYRKSNIGNVENATLWLMYSSFFSNLQPIHPVFIQSGQS